MNFSVLAGWESPAEKVIKTAGCRKLEMLTPKGEHFYPLFYQGDVRWENQSRRNRNRQNFVVGSYFLTALQSSENPGAPFWVVTCSFGPTCGDEDFSTNEAKKAKKSIFRLRISLQQEQTK